GREPTCFRRLLGELEPLQAALGAPLPQDPEELLRAAAVEAVLAAPLARLPFVVVVARGAGLEELLGQSREPDHGGDPLRLGRLRDLHAAEPVVEAILH